jgi:hypothetical protein
MSDQLPTRIAPGNRFLTAEFIGWPRCPPRSSGAVLATPNVRGVPDDETRFQPRQGGWRSPTFASLGLSWSPLLTKAGTATVNDGTARLNEALDTGDSGCADLAERPCESKRGAAITDNQTIIAETN